MQPLTTEEHDIEGLDGFMLNVEKLMSSELVALSSGDEFKAAVMLWCRAWKQVPGGSLPNDERVLAAFSGCGQNWPAVRDMALRGFVECDDGRLYHKTLCEDVRRAAEAKKKRHDRTRAATEARQRNEQRDVKRNDPPKPNVTTPHRRDETTSSLRSDVDPPIAPLGEQLGKSKRGTRLPVDWRPGEQNYEFGAGRGFSRSEVDEAGAEFRDYWCGVPGSKGLKLDWDGTFHNRLRDLAKRRDERAQRIQRRPNRQGPNSLVAAARAVAAQIEGER